MKESGNPQSRNLKHSNQILSNASKSAAPKKRKAWESTEEDAVSADGGIMLTTAEILDFAEGTDSTV